MWPFISAIVIPFLHARLARSQEGAGLDADLSSVLHSLDLLDCSDALAQSRGFLLDAQLFSQ